MPRVLVADTGQALPGRPPLVTDAELVCLVVARALLRYHDEQHWLRAATTRVGHLFPRLLGKASTTSGSKPRRG